MSSIESSSLRQVEMRIEWVLAHPKMSFGLKQTLRSALDRDPIDVLNEFEILTLLLRHRFEALIAHDQTKRRN